MSIRPRSHVRSFGDFSHLQSPCQGNERREKVVDTFNVCCNQPINHSVLIAGLGWESLAVCLKPTSLCTFLSKVQIWSRCARLVEVGAVSLWRYFHLKFHNKISCWIYVRYVSTLISKWKSVVPLGLKSARYRTWRQMNENSKLSIWYLFEIITVCKKRSWWSGRSLLTPHGV